jgi:hypothetical protein
MQSGVQGFTAEEVVEHAMHALLFDEPLPQQLGMLSFMADTGINPGDLHQAFALPNEIAPAITRIIIADGLIVSGRARRITSFELGPRTSQSRHVMVEWEDAKTYSDTEPGRRRVEGNWSMHIGSISP